MRCVHRKTTPKVISGRVQKKNRWRVTPNNLGTLKVAIERRRPGRGFRHVLRKAEVYTFINMLPNWPQLSLGLNRIVLGTGSATILGRFRPGEIEICAMETDLCVDFDREYFYRDIDFFDRLSIPYEFGRHLESWEIDDTQEAIPENKARCWFDAGTAKCFQLLRVLPHELGHHYDRMTNRKRRCSRGDEFAERYGRQIENRVWHRYVDVFGHPSTDGSD